MKLVRWIAQERADLPDVTNMSFLVLGEFRRMVRTVILGESTKNYVGRAFKCEPESPATTRVIVKMDPGGGKPLGFLLGSENVVSVLYGQIAGEKDDTGTLEGPAQVILDLAGQPVAAYTIQVRFVYTTSDNNNRAYWNPGGNVEFIAAQDTRHAPSWEARFSGGASAEWIDVASVAWDGVAVDAGEITDLRDFPFEGKSPFEKTSYGASGGVADFTRTSTRGEPDIGIAGLYAAVRALARQVQDLKGFGDDNKLNWYGRVHRPLDPQAGAGTIVAAQTKSLRSVDTVMYTVGDGVTEWGDFNGVNGLDDCLAYIQTNQASLPEKILVVLKTRKTTSFQFDLGGAAGTARTITNKYLEIRGEYGGEHAGSGDGCIEIDTDNFAALATALTVTGTDSGLTLRDLRINTPDEDITILDVERNLRLFHCKVRGRTDAAVTKFALILRNTIRGDIEDSEFAGRVRVTGGTWSVAEEGTLFRNCIFTSACVELTDGAGVRAINVRFQQCKFHGKDYTNSEGVIDGRGAEHITFVDCRLEHESQDQDLVRLGISGSTASKDWVFRGCHFEEDDAGSHTIGAGVNGAFGTGWLIFASGVDATSETRNILVDGCTFVGTSGGCKDSGAIFARGVRHLRVINSTFRAFKAASPASSSCTLIDLRASGTTIAGHVVSGCYFGQWATGASTRLERAIVISEKYCVIEGCTFDGSALDATDIPDRPSPGAAIVLSGAERNVFRGNIFHRWDPAETTGFGECIITTAGPNGRNVFANNLFEECGTRPIDAGASGADIGGDNCVFMGNIFRSTATVGTDLFTFGIYWEGKECTFVGNVFDFSSAGGGRPRGINIVGAGSTGCCVYGNSGLDAQIKYAAATSGCPVADTDPASPDSSNRNNVAMYDAP